MLSPFPSSSLYRLVRSIPNTRATAPSDQLSAAKSSASWICEEAVVIQGEGWVFGIMPFSTAHPAGHRRIKQRFLRHSTMIACHAMRMWPPRRHRLTVLGAEYTAGRERWTPRGVAFDRQLVPRGPAALIGCRVS